MNAAGTCPRGVHVSACHCGARVCDCDRCSRAVATSGTVNVVDYVRDARLNVACNVGAPNSEIRQRSLAIVAVADERDALRAALENLVNRCGTHLSDSTIDHVGRDLFEAANDALGRPKL